MSELATLADGREVAIDIAVPADAYIRRRELSTVDVELRIDGRVVAAVNTLLDPRQEREARELAREIKAGLESGELQPTVHSIEPLADTLR